MGGVHHILAYSWARLAILVAGNGRMECFYFFSFIPDSLSFLSLSFNSSTVSSISILPGLEYDNMTPNTIIKLCSAELSMKKVL